MAASPSTERHRRPLTAAERIVVVGAVAIAVSLLFPWYGLAFRKLSVTGLDTFGFAHAALLLTAGAAAFLVAREAYGLELPRPLQEAELVVIAGVWAAVLTGYLIADRPDEIAGVPEVQIRYGVFVALAASVAIAVGGLRMRAERAAGAAARR